MWQKVCEEAKRFFLFAFLGVTHGANASPRKEQEATNKDQQCSADPEP